MMLGTIHNMIDAFCPITGLSMDVSGAITINFKDIATQAQKDRAYKLLSDIETGKITEEESNIKVETSTKSSEDRLLSVEKDIQLIKQKLSI